MKSISPVEPFTPFQRFSFVKGFIIILSLIFLSFSWKSTTSIQLTVKGITEVHGNLMIAVYENAEEFPVFGKGDINIVHAVSSTVEKVRIDGLEEGGKYAVAVYHDVNKNKFLDKNFLGMPIERYGFSNDARGTFGPPYFSEASFTAQNGKHLTITIQ